MSKFQNIAIFLTKEQNIAISIVKYQNIIMHIKKNQSIAISVTNIKYFKNYNIIGLIPDQSLSIAYLIKKYEINYRK